MFTVSGNIGFVIRFRGVDVPKLPMPVLAQCSEVTVNSGTELNACCIGHKRALAV